MREKVRMGMIDGETDRQTHRQTHRQTEAERQKEVENMIRRGGGMKIITMIDT